MSNTTGFTNDCGITTIFPMGVTCVTKDATSPTSNNGSMTVFVSGGTPPYTIQWSNGMSGVFTLDKLPMGTYFATVTDYYGDYVKTASCVVGSLPITPTPTPSMTPTPTPSPSNIPEVMCLQLNQSPFTTLEFSYDSILFGYPQWTATTNSSILMYFNLINLRWEISNYPTVGSSIIVNPSQTLVPLGLWNELGTSNTWTLVSGPCPVQPLNVSYVTTDETCQNSADGTVTVTINGGLSPYTLALNNLPPVVTSATTYTFTGLNSGNNTLIVSDSTSQLSTQNITIGIGNIPITYQVIFTSSITTNGSQTQNSKNETLSWTLGVTPALSVGTTLTFNLNVSRNNYQQTSTIYGTSQVATFSGSNSLTTNNVTINSSGSTGPNDYTLPGSICGVFSGETPFDVTNMTITSQSSVSGIVNYSVSVPPPNNASCPVFGEVTVNVSVDSLSITGAPCAVVVQENQIISQQITVGINQVS